MSADWRMIVLDPAQIAAGELEKIRAEFTRYFLLRDLGTNIGIFTRRGKTGACEIYFSPDCQPYAEFLFERLPPQKARAPALLGTTLLVGYPAAVGALLGKGSTVISQADTARNAQPTNDAAASPSFLRLKSAG
jgi:hypothetical protein